MTPIDKWLYPDLVRFDPERRAEAIGRARRASLTWAELACLGVAVMAVTSVTGRWVRLQDVAEPVANTLGNFLLAIPLLAVLGGPVLWWRTRRSLRSALPRREEAQVSAR